MNSLVAGREIDGKNPVVVILLLLMCEDVSSLMYFFMLAVTNSSALRRSARIFRGVSSLFLVAS